jgi:site-specific DNA-methyltransferase (adenine-specific)
MDDIPGGSVQSVITSPPYWNLKDYGHTDQIGTSDNTYEDYLERLKTVLKESHTVLRESGTMWVVVDSFVERGDTKLLPHHVAEKAKEVGFNVQDYIVWYKPTAIAGYNDRTVVNKKEYVIFLSKTTNFDLYPSQDDSSGREDPANGPKDGLGNLWRHPIKRGSLGKKNILHKAPFPVSLAERLVRLSTQSRERVLDPFLGSGTTAYAALSTDREAFEYEINKDFEEVISERLSDLRQRTLPTEGSED